MNSLILTVHNKAWLIDEVYNNIKENASTDVEELTIIFDGCTDGSEKIIKNCLKESPKFKVKLLHTPDVWETKANNIGLRESVGDYCIIIQDDQVIKEKDFDRMLKIPFDNFPEVFAVTSRRAPDDYLLRDGVVFKDSGDERGTFYIRDVAIRGPLMLDHIKLETLNYLDESFAPLFFDDHDLCIRAYQKYGWLSGSFPINSISLPEWGSTRKPEKAIFIQNAYDKNEKLFIERYRDYLLQPKHAEERILL
jgi:glycosyltransferase involved in cell wall biosynthesis